MFYFCCVVSFLYLILKSMTWQQTGKDSLLLPNLSNKTDWTEWPEINLRPCYEYLARKNTCLKGWNTKQDHFQKPNVYKLYFQGHLWFEETRLNDVCSRINSTLFGGQGDDQKDNDDDVDDEDVDDDKDDDEDDDYHWKLNCQPIWII